MRIERQVLENYHLNSLKLEGYSSWYQDKLKGENNTPTFSSVFTNSMKATYLSENSYNNKVLADIRLSMYNLYPGILKKTNKMIKEDLALGEIPVYIQNMYNYHSLVVANKQGSQDTIDMSSHILMNLKRLYPSIQYVEQPLDNPERYKFTMQLQDHMFEGMKTGISRIFFSIGKFFKSMFCVGGVIFILMALSTLFEGELNIPYAIGQGLLWGIMVAVLWGIFGKIYLAIAGNIELPVDYSKGKFVN